MAVADDNNDEVGAYGDYDDDAEEEEAKKANRGETVKLGRAARCCRPFIYQARIPLPRVL